MFWFVVTCEGTLAGDERFLRGVGDSAFLKQVCHLVTCFGGGCYCYDVK